MRVRVLGSYGARVSGHHTSSLLVDGRLLIDAGTVSALLSLPEQVAIEDVLLTHAHLDHMVDLAFLVDNVLTHRTEPLRVWAPLPVLESLQRHLFNDQVWPDFTRLPSPDRPALRLHPLPFGEEGEVGGYRVQWVRTSHPVFAAGYLLSTEGKAVLFSGDTGKTEALWELGRSAPGLRAVFVETSFPDRLASLAEVSGHLTPAGLRSELEKLADFTVPVKILHMKPQFLNEIKAELEALQDPRLQVLHGGEEFVF